MSVATTLLSPRQDWASRRPATLLLLLFMALAAAAGPVVLAEHVAETLGGLTAERAEKRA